jgi:undecaprenyl-diphosphatase
MSNAFDTYFYQLINQRLSAEWLDVIMVRFSDKIFWTPLYALCIYFMVKEFGKKAVLILLFLFVAVAASDRLTSGFMKPYFGRLRPCHEMSLTPRIPEGVTCSETGSMASSHAANHFGVAMFLFITLKDFCGPYRYLFFLWAAIICYAQIYVGVHFPGDIAGGAVLGLSIGWMAASLYLRYAGSISPISTT